MIFTFYWPGTRPMRSESDSFTQDLGLRKAGGRNHLFTTNCIWNRKNHNIIALIWMCQDNIQNENSLWEKRNSPRPDSGGVMWRDLSLDLGSFSFAIFCSFHSIYHHHPHPWDDSSPSKYCFTKNKLNYLGEQVNLVSLKMICLIVPSNHCIAEFHQLLRISEETRFGQSEWI